jgi:DNA-directed RNA polymerase specialized sigma24 family protein
MRPSPEPSTGGNPSRRWRLMGRGQPDVTLALPDPDVWTAVRSLPLRQRTAVMLRYVADFAEADIAEAMGVSRGTVAATLSAARRSLALVLADEDVKEVPCG